MASVRRIAIIGGGPAGYEAAQVAAGLGADVTLIESDGVGGACVLYDCVPSKTLIATSEKVTAFRDAPAVGLCSAATSDVTVQLAVVNERVRRLAATQSADIASRLNQHGVTILAGRAGRRADPVLAPAL
jgi:pyruvate/2-oxoglutarate dehydrogenase complex dihydrolipoamide dehydrogenase (E3) component